MNLKDLEALQCAVHDAREELGLPPPIFPEKKLWLVWVAVTDSEGYVIHSGLFSSRYRAVTDLADWCRANYEERKEENDEPLPEDDEDAINAYFSYSDDSYVIDDREVDPD